jgi:queuine/archaeosine tRNA-ribosyltransferase
MIHGFGIGSASSMNLMFTGGFDSIDSMGYRLKAGFGRIQLSGVPDRFVKHSTAGRRCLDEDEKLILNECSCPTCDGLSLDEQMDILHNDYKARCIHNANLFLDEEWKFKTYLDHDSLDRYVDDVLSKGIYEKVYNYIRGEIE